MRSLHRIAAAASLLLAASLAASGAPSADIAGRYSLKASDGTTGFLTVGDDLVVTRRVYFKDHTIHTQTGKGALDGHELTVTFTGKGDPRNLTGRWSVNGESEQGRYRGKVELASEGGHWHGTLETLSLEKNEALPAVELAGELDDMKLVAKRGDAAVTYTLSADGHALAAKLSSGSETLRRSALVEDGGETATYSFEGAKVSGKLSSGLTERGARIATKKVSNETLLALPVAPDPLPVWFEAVRATSISKEPGGPEAKPVREKGRVPVRGKKDDLYVVGPFEGDQGYWMGYVKAADFRSPVEFKACDAPVFAGKRPSPGNVVQGNINTCYFDAALMALAETRPSVVTSMIRDLKDGTVAVRFYWRDEHHQLTEEWVRVKKTIPFDEKGESLYVRLDGTGQSWPALVTKGFAAWEHKGAGFYHGLDMGDSKDAFELVAGKDGKGFFWDQELPGHLGDEQLEQWIPRLSKKDREAIKAYRGSDDWKKADGELGAHPGRRDDLPYALSLVEKIPGLSKAGKAVMKAFYEERLDGPLGSGRYGTVTQELWQHVEECVKRKRPACASTHPWSKKTKKDKAEDFEAVLGLASPHFYAVVGAHEDDRKVRWVTVVNPTHVLSRVYERKGDALVASEKFTKDDATQGAFDIELSDFRRYYDAFEWIE